jgi:hypothetical protein
MHINQTSFGNNAGNGATNAFNSNFIGQRLVWCGQSSSNYLGYQAGYNASQSYSSNFFGTQLVLILHLLITQISLVTTLVIMRQVLITQILDYKLVATFASNSNFLGQNAGSGATNARNSNFLV